MYRNLSRPPSLLLWRNGFGGSREGKRIQKVGESPATFRPIVRVGRCRRWITGFSTGQLVPVSGTASSNREGGGVEHPTGLNERLGIILPFRSRLSLIRLSYLVPSSRRIHPSPPPPPPLPRRIFTGTDLNGPWRESSLYFYQLFPNQLFLFLFLARNRDSLLLLFRFFERSEPPREYRDLVSKGIWHNLA